MTEWIISQSEGKEMDLAEYYSFVNKRDEFRLEVAKHWQSQGVDVVLAPVGPTPAPLLETAKYWGVSGGVAALSREGRRGDEEVR